MSADIELAPDEVLAEAWATNAVDSKRARGLLRDIVAAAKAARDPAYEGWRMRYVKVVTLNNRHAGTFAEFVDRAGTVVQRRIRDYTFRDCRRIRCKHKAER